MLTSAQPPRDREFIERGEMIGEVRSPFEAVERTALTWGERDLRLRNLGQELVIVVCEPRFLSG